MSEKTEQPTHKKLDDARKKGNVARSKDFSKAIMLTSFLVYLMFAAPSIYKDVAALVELTSRAAYLPFAAGLPMVLNAMEDTLMASLVPLVVMVLLVGVGAEMILTGPLFVPEKIKPNIENIDFIKKAQQMFTAKSFIEFIKSLLKVIGMSFVVYLIVEDDLGNLARLSGSSLATVVNTLVHLVLKLLVSVTLIFIAFGAPDVLLQKLLFTRENKMSKDEVFREYKESEGDPHINSHRKQLHKELASGEGRVQNASAVVVNPTHVAVALYYRKGEVPLPLVLAKGEDDDARRIVRAAREHGIPIVRNIPVARALLADGVVDDFIPDWLIEPVAELLRTVAELAEQGPVDQAEMD